MAFLATFNGTVHAQLAPAGETQGAAAIRLTADEREWLARHRDIRLGVDVARPPFEYVDEKGAYTGISAEFIAAAAKRLGIAVVPQTGMKWTEAMEKVKVGEIDVIPKVTPSAAREKFLIFTKPYTTYPSVIVTRKDRLAGGLDDLRGLKVGVNKGQIIESNIAFVLVWNRRLGRAIRERERSERKIKAMSQAVDDALVMIDGRGKVLFWNPAAENLFGYTVAEAMGMDFHEMAVPAEAREKARAGLRRFAESGQGVLFGAARETTAINRTGEAFPVEVNLSPFQVDDEWFAVGTVRDIRERKKAEAELKEYVADLERFNRLVIGREERMIQLKEEINGLTEKLGGEKKYKIV